MRRGKRSGHRVRHTQQGLFSRCGEHILRGPIHKLIQLYEELSMHASNEIEAENFRQHAEHYRRLGDNEVFS